MIQYYRGHRAFEYGAEKLINYLFTVWSYFNCDSFVKIGGVKETGAEFGCFSALLYTPVTIGCLKLT